MLILITHARVFVYVFLLFYVRVVVYACALCYACVSTRVFDCLRMCFTHAYKFAGPLAQRRERSSLLAFVVLWPHCLGLKVSAQGR